MRAHILLTLLVLIAIWLTPEPAAAAAQARCSHGYLLIDGACEAIKLPEHGKLNFHGNGWVCTYGFQRFKDACVPVIVPRNATLAPNSDIWRCNEGYFETRGICLPREVVKTPRATPLDFKALREVARLQHKDGSFAYIGRVFAFTLAMALIAIGIMFFGRRRHHIADEVAPTLPQTQSFRPHRAAIAIGSAWEYFGERIDGLTGGPIAEGEAVTQCPTCQACYGAESIAVLRKENRGRCLACGSRIQRKVTRLKFETVRDTTRDDDETLALPAR